jgi:hypothetical protein
MPPTVGRPPKPPAAPSDPVSMILQLLGLTPGGGSGLGADDIIGMITKVAPSLIGVVMQFLPEILALI